MQKYNESYMIKILERNGHKPVTYGGYLNKDWVQMGINLTLIEKLDELIKVLKK